MTEYLQIKLSSAKTKPDSDSVSVKIVTIIKKSYTLLILRNTFRIHDETDQNMDQVKKYFNMYIENNFE